MVENIFPEHTQLRTYIEKISSLDFEKIAMEFESPLTTEQTTAWRTLRNLCDVDWVLLENLKIRLTPPPSQPFLADICRFIDNINSYRTSPTQGGVIMGIQTIAKLLLSDNPTKTQIFLWLANLNALSYVIQQKDIAGVTNDVKNVTKEAYINLQEIRDAVAKADSAIVHIQEAAGKAGVSKEAVHFQKEISRHHWGQFIWLGITAILTVGFIITAWFYNQWVSPISDTTQGLVQFVTTKILVFSTMAFAIAFSAKNYTASRHNLIVNRHRQNALLTYQALTEAAKARGTEDIILAHAAACIYSPQETGFSKSGGEGGGSKSVLELLTKNSTPGEK